MRRRLLAREVGRPRPAWVDALHLAVLSAFAVAQPLFDLLGRRPEFFAVRRSEPADLWLLVAFLCLALPLPLILLELLAGAVDRRLRRALHAVLCAALIAAVLLPPLDRALDAGPWAELIPALLAGVAGAFALNRWRPPRLLLSYLIPVLVVFPAVFLLRPGIVKILWPREVEATPATRATTPIVLLIFDELPVTSLLAGPHEIDAIRYPNFAALAEEATWYRHAVTASDFTVLAVPAILGGWLPDAPRLPLAPEHPHSLFTLLGERYAMNVSESVTQVCPARLGGDREEGPGARLGSLFADLRVLFQHLLLPGEWTGHLPPVTQNWMLFSGRDDWLADWKRRGRGNRAAQLDRFLDGIVPTDEPVLHFLNLLLPHPPFDYLPSGQRYSAETGVAGLDADTMADDEWAAVQNQQRHLLQLGYTDRVLGEVIARLGQAGLWERSVVAVTADHGVGSTAGRHRRRVTHRNFAEILSVPLLIKAPGQRQGRLDERPASLIDVLPTIAELAGAELPWPIDGISLADPVTPGRERLEVVRHRTPLPEPFEVSVADLEAGEQAALAVLDERFGTAEDGREIFHIGHRREWIGRRIADLPLAAPAPFKVRLKWPATALDVELGGSFVPAHLSGTLIGSVQEPVDLAVAVNGRIAAVTTSWSFEPSHWSAIVDPEAFRPGVNRVELVAFDPPTATGQGDDRPPILRPVPATIAPPFAGLAEHGLYGVEEWPQGAVRWTDGDAEVTFPIHRSRPPRRLRLTVAGNSPDGCRLRVRVNGIRLLDVRLEALKQGETWSDVLDLGAVEIGDQLAVEIESDAFVPSRRYQRSLDQRRLGVAILGFELLQTEER